MPTDAPTFNLKAVVRETGLKPDTIRAWERRYGVPKPDRTPGRHRLYTQHDIDLLKWMNARQHEGMSISRIVEMWKSLEAEGKDPLQMTAHSPNVKAAQLGDLGELANLRREWVNACLQFAESLAEQVVTQAFALFPLENVVIEVLLRGLSEIGEGWYRGDVTVQQEHFASALVVRRLNTLIAGCPAPTRPERMVLASPPDEQHTISLHVINLLLRRQSWAVIDLGANVPFDRLEKMLTSIRPQLVIASAQHLPTAQTLQAMADLVTRLHIPFAFGGGIFNRHPDLPDHISGHFLGKELTGLTRAVQNILYAPWPLRPVIETPKEYLTAAQHYEERLPLLETEVMTQLDKPVREAVQRAGANAYLALYITAALRLGDMSFLDADLEWVRGLITAQRLPNEALYRYLQAYRAAAQKHLDRRGTVILGWLQQALEELGEAAKA